MSRTRSRAATSSSRPSRAELLASEGKGLRDVIAPGLKVLFVGINPGLYSGWSGHHFARPGIVAFLGMGASCHAFSLKKTNTGRQPERFEDAQIWVLPNPSGLNANYQLGALAKLFRKLRKAAAD